MMVQFVGQETIYRSVFFFFCFPIFYCVEFSTSAMTGFQPNYPNVAQYLNVLLLSSFSGLRSSIKEIYNNEGLAGFFRYYM